MQNNATPPPLTTPSNLTRKYGEGSWEELGASTYPRPCDPVDCLKMEGRSTRFSRKN